MKGASRLLFISLNSAARRIDPHAFTLAIDFMDLHAVPQPAEDPQMDKAELSKMLEAQVLEKIQAGYQITTYAMDAIRFTGVCRHC